MGVARRVKLMAHSLWFGKEQDIHCSYNAIKEIDFVHERIHAGQCWYSSGHDIHLAVSPVRFALLKVDSGSEFHLRDFGIKTDQGPYNGTLYESPVIDVNSLGTPMPLENLNRNSSEVSNMQLLANPFLDVNSLGTYLDHGHVFEAAGGVIKQISGEISTIVTEWVLKPDTYYAAAFVNSSGADAHYVQHILGYKP